MPGYEDLTPDQIMLISYLVAGVIGCQIFGRLISDVMRLRTAKLIQFNVKREIIKNIQDKLTKERKPFIIKIKEWWKNRKQKEHDPFEKYI